MPSGSDAEYIPLLIAKTLNGGKAIVNVVTCNEEVGSGTLAAAGGKFFSPVEPIEGFTDGSKKNGDEVEGLAADVSTVAVDSRTPEGSVVDASPKIKDVLESCVGKDVVPIVHTVMGSKTGISESLPEETVMETIRELGGMVVVDACQARFQQSAIDESLKAQACILITGSKFFRSPPFCGGVFVPAPLMKRLADTNSVVPRGLNTFMGKSEIPQELENWRNSVQESSNAGLALRWEAALAEMEPTLAIDQETRVAKTKEWRNHIISYVDNFERLDYFRAAEDTDSIVSIRIKHTDVSKDWMNKSELAKVFKAMTSDQNETFLGMPGAEGAGELLKQRCFIGQPVLISKTEAVLRIALGSDSLRSFIENEAATKLEDETIIQKMAVLGENFGLLD